MTTAPILCRYEGDGNFIPANGIWAKRADERFVVGEIYRMEPREERSGNSHRHYFATIHEAWMNLPESQSDRFLSDEHLRKYALIKTGHADCRTFVCASRAEALRLADFLRDDFAVITVAEMAVTVWTAKSQSLRAMGAKEFQASKKDVLDYIAGLIGVTPAALAQSEAA